jgi:hypothetical protein
LLLKWSVHGLCQRADKPHYVKFFQVLRKSPRHGKNNSPPARLLYSEVNPCEHREYLSVGEIEAVFHAPHAAFEPVDTAGHFGEIAMQPSHST